MNLFAGLLVPLALAAFASVAIGAAPPAPVPGNWASAGTTPTRTDETAAVVLHNGRVLVPPQGLYDPLAGTWSSPTCAPASSQCPAPLNHPHRDSRALALIDGPNCGSVCGDALWVGGFEQYVGSRYDFSADRFHPADGSWTAVRPTNFPHDKGATATLLTGGPTVCGANCGRILVVGGERRAGCDQSSCQTGLPELYDPSLDRWLPATAGVAVARDHATATLLADGRVLVAGGFATALSGNVQFDVTSETEIFDPLTTSWHPGRPMLFARVDHMATLLPGGKVLIAGGIGCPTTSTGAPTCSQQSLLPPLASSELYDPQAMTSSSCPTAPSATCPSSMIGAHSTAAAVALPSGRVLVTGQPPTLGPAPEVYDPATGTWRSTGNGVGAARAFEGAVLMNCDASAGRVLVAGGGTYEAETWDGVPTVDSVTGSDGSKNGALIGPSAGGTVITVRGRWLRGTSARLLVGGVDTMRVSLNGAGTLVTGVTPPGAPGARLPIQLLLDGVPADMCGSHLFTYVPGVPTPIVGVLRPICGPLGTATRVVIPGNNLGSQVQVQFGTGPPVPASVGPGIPPWTGIVAVNSPSYSLPTTVPVTVSALGITLTAGSFAAPCPPNVVPTLSGITPACGPPGTPVTLTGQNLPPAVTVSFGGSTVAGQPDLLLQSVTATAPPHGRGPVPVIIPGPPPSNALLFDYEPSCHPSNPALIASLRQAEAGQISGGSAGDTHASPYLPAPPAGPPPAPAPAPVPVQLPGAVVIPQLVPNPGMAGVPQVRQQTSDAAAEAGHAMVRTGDAEDIAAATCVGAAAAGGLLCGGLAAGRRAGRRVLRPAPRWAR